MIRVTYLNSLNKKVYSTFIFPISICWKFISPKSWPAFTTKILFHFTGLPIISCISPRIPKFSIVEEKNSFAIYQASFSTKRGKQFLYNNFQSRPEFLKLQNLYFLHNNKMYYSLITMVCNIMYAKVRLDCQLQEITTTRENLFSSR